MQQVLAQNLRSHLQAVTSGRCTRAQLNAVVKVCHALAIVCLRNHGIPGFLNDLHGLSIPDMAMDCIGDIFQSDEDGRFVQLSAYFESLPLDSCSDEEALTCLRRLVFSKTYHGIFRLYNEADPTLGKVLRNIKISLQGLSAFQELTVLGEPAIVPAACEHLEHLPIPDRETLERGFSQYAAGQISVPAMLAQLARYLREQRLHSRIVMLIDVAFVFRASYGCPPLLSGYTEDQQGAVLRMDVERILREVHRTGRATAERSYVATGKLEPEMLDTYFRVIDAGLRAVFVEMDGSGFSLYEGLKAEWPLLTVAEYRRKHRSRLEYLSREAHRKMRDLLQKA